MGVLLLQSCKEAEVTSSEEVLLSGYDVSVRTPAGSFENLENQTTLPPPFNLARLNNVEDVEIIVLSETLKEGKSLKVIPVGLLRFVGKEQNTDYVISVPSDEKLNNLGISSYGDLSVNHMVSKHIVEAWCKENVSKDASNSTRWLSEQSAIAIISQRDQKEK